MNRRDTDRGSRLLALALAANALFSALSGLVCLLARDGLAGLTGVAAVTLGGLGVDLLVFAAFLAFLASRRDLERRWIQAAVLVVATLDVLWVAGSAAVLLAPGPLTVAGKWIVAAVAVAVADFAVFQLLGWWRIRQAKNRPPALATAA